MNNVDNLLIAKADSTNIEQVLDFLANECYNLYYELNKNEFDKYIEKYGDLVKNSYIREYKYSYYASIDDIIIGAAYIDADNYLNSLFVKKEFRNIKIGTMLLKKLISEVSDNSIIRVDANIKSISLYEKFQFHEADGLRNKAFIPMELERCKVKYER